MPDVKLPDFDDLIELAKEIGRIKTGLEMDKNRLDMLLAEITDVVSSNDVYFINDKPPSMAYITANYHSVGYDDITKQQIENLRNNIATNAGLLREKEIIMDIYRDMIDVWRTQSANERNAMFEGA